MRKPVNEWDAIVFDLDDTLYPERDYVLSGYAVVAASCGRLGLDPERCMRSLRAIYNGPFRNRAFDRLLEITHHDTPGMVEEMVSVYREHTPDIRPYPGVPRLLERLGGRLKLGLVSDGRLDTQRKKLAALGLAERFGAVVFSDALGRENWKPSPRPLLEAARLLGVDPARCVYVADNPQKDFLAARRAGMAGWRVRPEHGVYAKLEPETPDHAPHRELPGLAALEELLAEPSGP